MAYEPRWRNYSIDIKRLWFEQGPHVRFKGTSMKRVSGNTICFLFPFINREPSQVVVDCSLSVLNLNMWSSCQLVVFPTSVLFLSGGKDLGSELAATAGVNE